MHGLKVISRAMVIQHTTHFSTERQNAVFVFSHFQSPAAIENGDTCVCRAGAAIFRAAHLSEATRSMQGSVQPSFSKHPVRCERTSGDSPTGAFAICHQSGIWGCVMIRLFAVIPSLALVACGTAPSRTAELVYRDKAEVTRVEPLYRPVQVARPIKRCWMERVTHTIRPRPHLGATLAGGVIGGVIGHELGPRRGQAPLTVAGALAGAAIGRGLSRQVHAGPASASRDVQRCTTIDRYEQRQQLIGYSVEYRYAGQTFTTQTRHHPGRYLRMRVQVDPADGG